MMECLCSHDLDAHTFEEFGDEVTGCDVALCPCEGYVPDTAMEIDRLSGV